MKGRRRRDFHLPPDHDRVGEEVDEELRFHLERRAERLMREGMDEAEAWAEARRRFGDVDRVRAQITRDEEAGMMRRAVWDRVRQDVRYAARQMLGNRAFTAVTVLTLALGIGATTSIFSVVDGILFRPLDLPEPEELTVVWSDMTRRGGPVDEWPNFHVFYTLQERARSLESVAAWGGVTLTLTGLGEPEQLSAGGVTHEMLSDVLGVEPALGRGFAAEDDVPGAAATVLLSHGFWRRALAGAPDVVGSTLTLNDEAHTVIGVLPERFDPPIVPGAEVWTTLRQSPTDNFCGRGGACLHIVARRADGVSLEAARVEATEIARQLEQEDPEAFTGVGLNLVDLQADMVSDSRAALLVLLAAVGFVLLIACVNVANLLMARATTRGAELAVRSALGAGRGRLTSQLLTESALLALLGGAFGLTLAYVGTDLLVGLAPPTTPRIEGVGVDGRVLAFAAGVTLLAGVVFGVAPAIRSTRGDVYAGLREGGRSGAGSATGLRMRGALVSAQVALALILLVGAGLLVRSFENLRARDLGFRADGVLTMQIGLPSTRYPELDDLRGFVRDLEERLAALPGVEAVGATSWLPLTGFGSDVGFTIEGRPVPPAGQGNAVWFRRITPGYPDALGMRLVAGRWVTEADDENAPRVVVVNEGLARRFFPDEDPIGKRINLNDPMNPTWREIVGVAVEARYFGVRDGSRDALYIPYRQSPSASPYFALRSARDPAALAGEVRATVTSADPLLAVARIQPMETLVADAMGPERFVTSLLGLFAAVALTLAVVGLYGVVSYGVSQRLREMGVRVALGAEGGHVRRLVLRQSLSVVVVGLAVGVAGGLAVTGLLDHLLFEVSATDPWTYGVVSLVLAAVAVAASAIPAHRAARVDPIRVLKAE